MNSVIDFPTDDGNAQSGSRLLLDGDGSGLTPDFGGWGGKGCGWGEVDGCGLESKIQGNVLHI